MALSSWAFTNRLGMCLHRERTTDSFISFQCQCCLLHCTFGSSQNLTAVEWIGRVNITDWSRQQSSRRLSRSKRSIWKPMLLHFAFTSKTLKGPEKDLASATWGRFFKMYVKALILSDFIKVSMILKWHKKKLLSSSTTKGKSLQFFVLAYKYSSPN